MTKTIADIIDVECAWKFMTQDPARDVIMHFMPETTIHFCNTTKHHQIYNYGILGASPISEDAAFEVARECLIRQMDFDRFKNLTSYKLFAHIVELTAENYNVKGRWAGQKIHSIDNIFSFGPQCESFALFKRTKSRKWKSIFVDKTAEEVYEYWISLTFKDFLL